MRILLIFFVILLLSCSSRPKVFRNIIPTDTLIYILVDINLADGMYRTGSLPEHLQSNDSLIYIALYSKYGYSREKLDCTFAYYIKYQPEQLEKIYEKVISILSKMEGDVIHEKKQEAL